MNDKLSLQDLVDLLSKKAKITKKDADSFFREFFQLILERIFDNDSVKVKDFGTFKLISVSSRESVNVNTGEKIEIPSHYKLSFIPDKILKNLVNKPFSQFETILLEDGVVFETMVENEDEGFSEDESVDNTDIYNEDEDVVSEIEKQVIEDPAPIILNTTNTQVKEEDIEKNNSEKESKTTNSSRQIYPRSFVYTYTTSKPNEESDSITLTVPKEDLTRIVAGSKPKEKESKPPVVEDVSKQKDFQIELLDLPHIPVDKEEEVADGEEEPIVNAVEEEAKPVETKVEDIQPEDSNEGVLKAIPLVESLRKSVISDDLELESDFDSEIETEEDIIVPVAIPIIDRLAKEKKDLTYTSDNQNQSESEKKSVFTNEDPERPLLPGDEDDLVSDVDFTSLDKPAEKEVERIENSHVNASVEKDLHSYAGNNKPAETRSVSFSDTIDPVDIPYHDFNKPSLGSKIRKFLPVILFVSVIVVPLTYGLIKMLNKPYEFEANLGRTNLTLSDTLPFVDEVTPKVSMTDVMLDSMKRVQAGDTAKIAKKEPEVRTVKEPVVQQKVETPKVSIVGDTDSLTRERIKSENNSFVISDKLKFSILNKAEFHLDKYKEGGAAIASDSQVKNQADLKAAASKAKPNYATIKRGTTLRTIAVTYYGNPDYWVYIYQANKKNITNPNNVPIGTSLLVPPLSDYGVSNPKDPKAIQAAKKLEAQILSLR